jgi:hypothetical protein
MDAGPDANSLPPGSGGSPPDPTSARFSPSGPITLGLPGAQPSGDPTPPVYDQTTLVLTPDQESRFASYVHARIDECRQEMGLNMYSSRGTAVMASGMSLHSSRWSTGIDSVEDSWAFRRELNQRHYDGDYSDRKREVGSVFQASNHSFNLPKHWTRTLASKLDEVQLLTEPFWAAMPQRTTSEDRSKAVEAYLQDQLSQSNVRGTLQEARQAGLIRNEAPVKVSWVRRASTFKGPARVLVNSEVAPAAGADGYPVTLPDGSPMLNPVPLAMSDGSAIDPGAPVRLPNGDYIFEHDDVIPAVPKPGQVLPPGAMCLLKEPSFIMPPQGQAVYQDFPALEQVEVDYEGLQADTLYFKDFLWPVRAASLDNADIMVHVYDASLGELRRTFGGFDTFEVYASSFGTAEVSRGKQEQGEIERGSIRELVGVHECYVLGDPDETGEDKWIFCPYDYQRKKFIFRDYLKNHTKKPPFVLIPGVEKVQNRAYGAGVYEMSRDKSHYVDLMFNRVNFSASRSGVADFLCEDALVATQDGALAFTVGDGNIWKIKMNSGYGPDKPPLFRVKLEDVPEAALELMEKMIQAGQLEFGIVTAGDTAASNLPSQNTATGIIDIQQTGNALQNKIGDVHARAFTDVLELCMDIALENMPDNVAFMMPDGQTLAMLNREEIRAMPRDVRLLLTRARSADSLQKNAQATQLVLQYLGLPKWQQKLVRPFFINQLSSLDVQDADERLPDPTPEQIQAEAQQLAQGAAAPQKPAAASVVAKLTDFAPSEQQQLKANDYKITPASPQELAQMAATAAQNRETPAPAHSLGAGLHSLPPPAAA